MPVESNENPERQWPLESLAGSTRQRERRKRSLEHLQKDAQRAVHVKDCSPQVLTLRANTSDVHLRYKDAD